MCGTASPRRRWRPCGETIRPRRRPRPGGKALYGAAGRRGAPYGGRMLRCMLTPGHTPGHLCLYDPARRRLFCGDHVLFHITPNICRWQGVEDSLGDYLSSLDRTAALDTAELYPGPPGETGDLRQRAAELTAHHARRLEDTPARPCEKAPGLTAYQIAGRMRWSIRCRELGGFSPDAEVLCRGRGPGPSGPSGGPRAGVPPGDTWKTGIFRLRGRQQYE